MTVLQFLLALGLAVPAAQIVAAGTLMRRGVLVKAPKPQQDARLDLPAIGLDTVRQAAAAGLDELCWDLALTPVTLFEVKGYFDLWRETAELGLKVTERADNRTGRAAMLYSLGTLYMFQKRTADAQRCYADAMPDQYTVPIRASSFRSGPNTLTPTGVRMPVANMSIRPLMGMVHELVTPGKSSASSISSMSFSNVIPSRPAHESAASWAAS